MNDAFEIPVTFNAVDISFMAELVPSGYITRIAVDVYGQQMIFEPDEEGQYRVVIESALLTKYSNVNISLLKEIANVLNSVKQVS